MAQQGRSSRRPHADTRGHMTNGQNGAYAQTNGVRMYYETHGAGEPLILLHGGVGGIHMFGPNLAALAATRRVVAAELQGHGRTADINRPLRYELLAEDVAALMAHLRLEKADLAGYSFGGGVALQLAFRHPDLVRRLVVVATPAKRDGFYPEVIQAFDQMGPETGKFMKDSPLARLYPDVDWPTLFGKIGDLQRRPYDWSQQVAALHLPVLLVFADADAIRPAHIVDFFECLGGGKGDAGLDGLHRPVSQLAVLPGLTHYSLGSAPALGQVISAFLDATIESSR
jgi:pimeloyl-ACP methyl ester carboxylesterase